MKPLKEVRNSGKRNNRKNQEIKLTWTLKKETVKEKAVVISVKYEAQFRK